MKVLTSLLVLTLTGPTLGYPYTRGVASRTSGRGREQVLEGGLGEYLGGYMQDQQYALPEYQPTYRHGYAAQRPRINAVSEIWLDTTVDFCVITFNMVLAIVVRIDVLCCCT